MSHSQNWIKEAFCRFFFFFTWKGWKLCHVLNFKISNMLRIFTIQKKKTVEDLHLDVFFIVAFVTAFFEVTLFSSGLIAHEQHKLRNSSSSCTQKEHSIVILNFSYTFMMLWGMGFLQLFLDITALYVTA
ncbi:hypothetical protein CEXT_219841 [Caerostris extrusa]|uniref:Uncharacterized protein n=1 Tax=Caerostris extrusa TaxID=172846 RepID=A0AAV4QS92_CAEEX|nr:hypothetical protein CEXT_219841 [Caerostris extrusa]